MTDQLEQFLLKAVIAFLQSLSNEQLLALTCNLNAVHDGLIIAVHDEFKRRGFRDFTYQTASVFDRSKRFIRLFFEKKPKAEVHFLSAN